MFYIISLLLISATFLFVAISPVLASGAKSFTVFVGVGVTMAIAIVQSASGAFIDIPDPTASLYITAGLLFWKWAIPFYYVACLLKGLILFEALLGQERKAVILVFGMGNFLLISALFVPPVARYLF